MTLNLTCRILRHIILQTLPALPPPASVGHPLRGPLAIQRLRCSLPCLCHLHGRRHRCARTLVASDLCSKRALRSRDGYRLRRECASRPVTGNSSWPGGDVSVRVLDPTSRRHSCSGHPSDCAATDPARGIALAGRAPSGGDGAERNAATTSENERSVALPQLPPFRVRRSIRAARQEHRQSRRDHSRA